jgi:Predicted membrane protein
MISDKFRRELREQAKLWEAEGLIDTSFYQQLSERYQFNTLETASRNRFLSILMSLGGILLGIGVITFVAANWQVWSREVRVAMLLSLFVAVNAAGFLSVANSPIPKQKLPSKYARNKRAKQTPR